MLYGAFVFLAIAVVAAVLGFGGIATGAAGILRRFCFSFSSPALSFCCWQEYSSRKNLHKQTIGV